MSRRRNTKKGATAARASNSSKESESSEGSDDDVEVIDKMPEDEDEKVSAKVGAKQKNEWPWPPKLGTIELVNDRIDHEVKEEKAKISMSQTVTDWVEALGWSSLDQIAVRGFEAITIPKKTKPHDIPKEIHRFVKTMMKVSVPNAEPSRYQDVLLDILPAITKTMITCLIETENALFSNTTFDATFKKFIGKFSEILRLCQWICSS